MSEWSAVELRSLFDVSIPGEWGSAPNGIDDTYVLRAADFTKDCRLKSEVGAPRVIPVSKLTQRKLVKGDLLIEKSGGSPDQPVGRVVYFDRESDKYSLSNFLQLLRVKADFDPLWSYYLLTSLYNANIVLRYQQQTTGIINFKLDQYLSEKIEIPLSIVEQQKIANILTTVDNLIEKTQALIDKYTQIKQGMMADLFTRGIDLSGTPQTNPNHGQLRPSVEDAPELYQQTELGLVPREWEVLSLKEKIKDNGFVQTGPFGSQLHSYEYVESGVPVVMPQDIVNGEIVFDKIAQITNEKARTIARHKVRGNDVVFSRRGDLTRSAFISKELSNTGFICGTGCLLLRVNSSVIHGGWFSALYGTRFIQDQVDGLAVGTTMANLNSKILGKLNIAFPSIQEQEESCKRIEDIDRLLRSYLRELGQYALQKKGLMQDLLTGKVQVK